VLVVQIGGGAPAISRAGATHLPASTTWMARVPHRSAPISRAHAARHGGPPGLPFDTGRLAPEMLVVDLIFGPEITGLL
jgi:hypothetical protein